MKQLIYVSSASGQMSDDQLIKLLEKARIFNKEKCLTGLLLYQNGNFMQVLEGEDPEVNELYDKIKIDRRHKGLIVILEEEVDKRYFPDWSMGFRNVTNDNIEGFSDYFIKGKSKDEEAIIAGNAKKLLSGFRDRVN